jgi:hypothetical protein
MVSPETERLSDIAAGLQEALEGSLRGGRAVLVHPGAKGEASENDWIRVLKDHLPARYHADRAFVIDSRGQVSDQIDIVIYDRQYSPLLFNQTSQRFVPAESVYAVLEVKQNLSRDHIEYAAGKAASVRRLHRTSSHIKHAGGVFQPVPAPRIVAGIVAYQSDWSPGLGDALVRALSEQPPEGRLDLGCALVDGAFEVAYGEAGDALLETTPANQSLVQFLLRLLRQLQAVGSVPAIDYTAYLATLTAESPNAGSAGA